MNFFNELSALLDDVGDLKVGRAEGFISHWIQSMLGETVTIKTNAITEMVIVCDEEDYIDMNTYGDVLANAKRTINDNIAVMQAMTMKIDAAMKDQSFTQCPKCGCHRYTEHETKPYATCDHCKTGFRYKDELPQISYEIQIEQFAEERKEFKRDGYGYHDIDQVSEFRSRTNKLRSKMMEELENLKKENGAIKEYLDLKEKISSLGMVTRGI